MTIQYIKKSNYGNEAMYVVGEAAESIAKLTGRKTINHGDIKALESLGITCEYLAT
jgi:histone H3/H4